MFWGKSFLENMHACSLKNITKHVSVLEHGELWIWNSPGDGWMAGVRYFPPLSLQFLTFKMELTVTVVFTYSFTIWVFCWRARSAMTGTVSTMLSTSTSADPVLDSTEMNGWMNTQRNENAWWAGGLWHPKKPVNEKHLSRTWCPLSRPCEFVLSPRAIPSCHQESHS